jgi:GDP-L-fucose synthase
LHVDDLADAVLFALTTYDGESHLNVGTGSDISIAELAEVIADVVGWDGEFIYDASMPDGTPRKLLDVSLLRDLGWSSRVGLRQGIAMTYAGASVAGGPLVM